MYKVRVETKEKFKDQNMFKIFVTDKNDKEENYPSISFGIKKAKIIVSVIEDLKKFIEENES